MPKRGQKFAALNGNGDDSRWAKYSRAERKTTEKRTSFCTGSSSSTRNSRRSTWSFCEAGGLDNSRQLRPDGSDWVPRTPSGCRWMASPPSPIPTHSQQGDPRHRAKLHLFGCLFLRTLKGDIRHLRHIYDYSVFNGEVASTTTIKICLQATKALKGRGDFQKKTINKSLYRTVQSVLPDK